MFWIGTTVRPALDTTPEIMSRADSPGGHLRFPGFHSTLNAFPHSYETKLKREVDLYKSYLCHILRNHVL